MCTYAPEACEQICDWSRMIKMQCHNCVHSFFHLLLAIQTHSRDVLHKYIKGCFTRLTKSDALTHPETHGISLYHQADIQQGSSLSANGLSVEPSHRTHITSVCMKSHSQPQGRMFCVKD